MNELYDSARKAFESKQAKMNTSGPSKTEDSEEAQTERRQRFKVVQAEFVKYVTQVGTELAQKCFNDPEYTKSFVDVFKFNPPPKRNDSQNVYFQELLLIELMEGPQTSGYLEFFKDCDTDTTLSMLQNALSPFRVHYGYFPRFGGNIIQIRLDDTVPKWSLNQPEQFERKKAMSRKNREKSGNSHVGNTRRPFNQHRPAHVADLFRLLSQGYNRPMRGRGGYGRGGFTNGNFNRNNNMNRGANFNRSTSPNQQYTRNQYNNNGNNNRNGNRNNNYRTNNRQSFNGYSEFKNDYSRSGNKYESNNDTQHNHQQNDDYLEVEE